MTRSTGAEKDTVREVTTCHQPAGCERARHNDGDNRLDSEELSAPAHCVICRTVLCDDRAAWCEKIPTSKIPTEQGNNRANLTTPGVLCSDHFNENWA